MSKCDSKYSIFVQLEDDSDRKSQLDEHRSAVLQRRPCALPLPKTSLIEIFEFWFRLAFIFFSSLREMIHISVRFMSQDRILHV